MVIAVDNNVVPILKTNLEMGRNTSAEYCWFVNYISVFLESVTELHVHILNNFT
jgi:hypothetical protein